jgi:glycerol-3-phosphate acyltransferase PlsX
MFGASVSHKLGAVLVQDGLRGLKRHFSAERIGGAPLLGVKGSCIVGHGSSSAYAISSAIAVAARCARLDVPGQIAEAID